MLLPLSRLGTLLVALGPLLIVPPSAQPHAASSASTPAVVPFPQSLRLLDELEGTRSPAPPASRTEYPRLWNGAPAFDPEESAALLGLEIGATQRALRLMAEMRALAVERIALLPPMPLRWALQPSGVVAKFRARRQVLERLILSTRFQGYALLTASPPVAFLFPRFSSGRPQRIFTQDLSDRTLGLASVDIADDPSAQTALDLLDDAMVTTTSTLTGFEIDRQEFEEGPPRGGLIEVEVILERLRALAVLACDWTRNDTELLLLDSRFQSDVSRLDALSASATYEGQPLLRGGVVLLQGAGARVARLFALPDTRVPSLRIGTDITYQGNALGALQLIDAALVYVNAQRAVLERVRVELQRSTPHSR
jgi:hypothetical protein